MTTPAPALHEPWSEPERQHEAIVFGLWVFLASEMLFFGGILLFYAASRHAYGSGFIAGAREASVFFGTFNTFVLMTSSLTIAVAERAIRAGRTRWSILGLWATVALGGVFLVVKGLEYADDISKHLLPGPGFPVDAAGAQLFWGFYWTVTVVHAIHLTIGIGAVGRLLLLARKGELAPRWMGVEGTTLYWHLVDIVWVMLYPLIYLAGRP